MTVYYAPNNGFTVNDTSFYTNKVLRHDLGAAAVHRIHLRSEKGTTDIKENKHKDSEWAGSSAQVSQVV